MRHRCVSSSLGCLGCSCAPRSLARSGPANSAKMAGRGLAAASGILARRARSEKDQPKAENEFGGAGQTRNSNHAPGFDQNPLILDHFLLRLGRKCPAGTNQRGNRHDEENDSEDGVERDFHARCSLLEPLSRDVMAARASLAFPLADCTRKLAGTATAETQRTTGKGRRQHPSTKSEGETRPNCRPDTRGD